MKNKKVFTILIVVALVIGGIVFFNSRNTPKTTSFSKDEINADLLTYIDYSSTTRFQNEKNVIFFAANWCGTCTIADKNFMEELKNIPKELTIYKADFERETTLRKKYGIAIQHAFVQVDHQGNPLKTWYGSYTIDEVLQELV